MAPEQVAPLEKMPSDEEEILVAAEYAYQVALEEMETATASIENAAELHRQSRDLVRKSMREGGPLTFADNMPPDIARRARANPEIGMAIRRHQIALSTW